MTDRLSTTELHDRFVAAVGPSALVNASTDDSGALVVELRPPLPGRIRVYIYNATDPPGGRPTPEHKIQLTGQRRGERGEFDWSKVDFVLVCGYAAEHDVFLFWDAALRIDFAYSTSLEVKSANVQAAAASGLRVRQDRRLKTGMEVVICAPSRLLVEGHRGACFKWGSRLTRQGRPGNAGTAIYAPFVRRLRDSHVACVQTRS